MIWHRHEILWENCVAYNCYDFDALGFRFIPVPEGVMPYGMAVAGVYFVLIYGWSMIDTFWPSLFGVFLIAMAGYGTAEALVLAMFNNTTVLMLLIGSLTFAAISQNGSGDWFLSKLLGNKFARKSTSTILIFIVLTALLGNMINLTYFTLFPILSDAIKKYGYNKGNKECFFILGGFMMAAAFGLSFKPFAGWALMTVGALQAATSEVINLAGR